MKTIDLKGVSPEITEYILTLETQLNEQTTQLQEQSKKVESQKIRIDRLMDMLANFQKTMYGQSSEKSKYVLGEDANQISLFNEAEAESNSKAPEPTKVSVSEHIRKAKRTKEELAADIPVVEILCELDEAKCVCGKCTGKMRFLGKEVVREELEIIPAKVRLLRFIQQSYVCERCERETGEAMIMKAPTPAPVIKRSLASASTVAHVMYQKDVNGMPLYRQEKDWANQGLILSRATLANWIIRSANDWLMPLWEVMKSHLLKQAVAGLICEGSSHTGLHSTPYCNRYNHRFEANRESLPPDRVGWYSNSTTGEVPVLPEQYTHIRDSLDHGLIGVKETASHAIAVATRASPPISHQKKEPELSL